MKRPDQIKTAPDQGRTAGFPLDSSSARHFRCLPTVSSPNVDLASWKLRVYGLVQQEVELDWPQLQALDWTVVTADFHCVTQWSSLDNTWEGVPFATVASLSRPDQEAAFVMVHCYGGYTTKSASGPGHRRGTIGP